MNFDHVAIAVKNKDIEGAAAWYKENMSAEILYLDKTWALLKVFNLKIALVIPSQHPPHIAFKINEGQYLDFKKDNKVFKKHRDGSESFYEKDMSGNILEFVFWKKIGQEN